MRVVIVGTVAFDAIETPFGKTDKIIGGAAMYAGLAASYFSNQVKLVSVVGSDFPPFDFFDSHHITTEGIQVKEGEKSFFWAGKYHEDMNSRDTLATELNVLAGFDPVIPESYQNSEYLLLGNLTPQVQQQTLDRLRKRPKLVVLDTMNFWMDVALEDLLKVLKQVDVLTINDAEARQLSGEYALRKAARKILTMGPRFLVIKKGEHGALLFHGDQMFSAPGLPIEDVFDPTGAGDSFAGGFIGYMAQQGADDFDTMKNALIFGSAMASFCVEKFGNEKLLNLSPQQIRDRVNEFVRLSHFQITF